MRAMRSIERSVSVSARPAPLEESGRHPGRATGTTMRYRPIASHWRALLLALLCTAFASAIPAASARLPAPVARAFTDAGIPLDSIAVVVTDTERPGSLLTHNADRPMNPASVMKLVTTFAALELLGPEYRWRTEAYLGGPLTDGTLEGDLLLKGYGDPKITIEQWQGFMATLRAQGLARITGDLVLDRSQFRVPAHDPSAFDGDPLRPYNVGPDALLLNFKAVRFLFVPDAAAGTAVVRMEPPLPQVTALPEPRLASRDCNDWRATVGASFVDLGDSATARFSGTYPALCGERDWYVALLDPPTYALGMFTTYFREAGGTFGGGVRSGSAPAGAAPFARLESPPLAEIVRDVNKLSNNVMARQLFLTLAMVDRPPPATIANAEATIREWLSRRNLKLPGLVLDNGAGLSRRERVTASGLARLLAAADESAVRDTFENSLAIAAIDGTLERRFQGSSVSGQALLKTGTLEGVKALAGYVRGSGGRRYIVVAIVNHPAAAQAQPALDFLVGWVHHDAGADRNARKPGAGFRSATAR